MRIIVCVKQVPDTTEVKIDPKKGTLIREGVESIMNPDDAVAMEFAVRLKEKHKNVGITAISMGPPQAKEVLQEAIGMARRQAPLHLHQEIMLLALRDEQGTGRCHPAGGPGGLLPPSCGLGTG